MKNKKEGRLYIVPTPIGNIKDITIRAIEVLKDVDKILVESFRKSTILATHFEIKTKRVLNNIKNEHRQLKKIIAELKAGKKIAITTDSGTPAISDPGFLLIRECIKESIDIDCLPGATALIPALVVSGFSTDKFVFEGFFPKRKKDKALSSILNQTRTTVMYESPHRILKTLESMINILGKDKKISLSREISKLHSETVRGSIEEVKRYFDSKKTIKGEFIITIEGKKVKD